MTFEELLSQKKLVAVINATAKSLESSSISYEDCVAEGQLALWSIASSGDSDLSRIDDLGSYLRSAMRNAVSKRVAIDDASGMRYESFDSDTSTRQLTKCDERLLISSGQDSVDSIKEAIGDGTDYHIFMSYLLLEETVESIAASHQMRRRDVVKSIAESRQRIKQLS